MMIMKLSNIYFEIIVHSKACKEKKEKRNIFSMSNSTTSKPNFKYLNNSIFELLNEVYIAYLNQVNVGAV